jgi:hypothetical protein
VLDGIDDFELMHRRMETEVPPCPACQGENTAIRERVLRGDAGVDFWCCPCGAKWRDRVTVQPEGV